MGPFANLITAPGASWDYLRLVGVYTGGDVGPPRRSSRAASRSLVCSQSVFSRELPCYTNGVVVMEKPSHHRQHAFPSPLHAAPLLYIWYHLPYLRESMRSLSMSYRRRRSKANATQKIGKPRDNRETNRLTGGTESIAGCVRYQPHAEKQPWCKVHRGFNVGYVLMILPQVHLRKPCYDFYFL